MNTQIQFKSGQFQTYRATRSFLLGDTGIKIQQGAEIEYDGMKAVYEGNGPMNLPSLRGALKLGWLVLDSLYDPNDLEASRPVSAGMRIRDAQGGNPLNPTSRTPITTVAAEDREVGNVHAHAQATRNLNARRPGAVPPSSGMPGARVEGVQVFNQTGVEVYRVATPTHTATNVETQGGEAIRQANSVRIQPGQGRTRDELAQNLSPEEAAEYFAELEARKNSYVEGEHPQAARERAANEAKLAQRQIVGRVGSAQTQHKEGFTVHSQVGGGVEITDLGGSGLGGEVSFEESEGMRFTNTNVTKPKPMVRQAPVQLLDGNGATDFRRTIARSICPDFPDNYVFEEPIRKKIARLQADFDDRPDVIRAVAAAETDDEVKRRLVEEFPEAFG